MVEHVSANPKVPGSIPAPGSYRVMDYDKACVMHLTPKGCVCIGFLSPVHKKIPDSYSKREGGNPANSGLSSQQ